MEKIKTFEDACAAIGVSSNSLPDFPSSMPEDHRKAMEAFYKLRIIAEALNEGWKPNWSNYNEYKYVPWFEEKESGSGLSFGDAARWLSLTVVGSRLCFKSRDLAKYAATQFADLYSDFMNL